MSAAALRVAARAGSELIRTSNAESVVFLGLNGVDLDIADDDAYDLVISVAEGRRSWQETAQWLRERGVTG